MHTVKGSFGYASRMTNKCKMQNYTWAAEKASEKKINKKERGVPFFFELFGLIESLNEQFY